ncbi:flagellar M-ring protein FliF [Burkholderia pseudomallei A79C]|nr:flagellar M-ring protein FliF [Burkholderia pseudomallei A79C]
MVDQHLHARIGRRQLHVIEERQHRRQGRPRVVRSRQCRLRVAALGGRQPGRRSSGGRRAITVLHPLLEHAQHGASERQVAEQGRQRVGQIPAALLEGVALLPPRLGSGRRREIERRHDQLIAALLVYAESAAQDLVDSPQLLRRPGLALGGRHGVVENDGDAELLELPAPTLDLRDVAVVCELARRRGALRAAVGLRLGRGHVDRTVAQGARYAERDAIAVLLVAGRLVHHLRRFAELLARFLDTVVVDERRHADAEIPEAERRRQQILDIACHVFAKPRRDLVRARQITVQVDARGQKRAMLIDDRNLCRRQIRHTAGDEIDDRGDLLLRKTPSRLERQHDGGGALVAVHHHERR